MANPWEKDPIEEKKPWEQDEIEPVDRRRKIPNRGEQIGVPNEKTGLSNIDVIRGGVQSYLKGALLGAGDEVAAAGRAMVDRLVSTDADRIAAEITGGDRQSLADAYQMYLRDERDVTREFEDEYGKTALALNVAGGLLSPANAVRTGQAATRLGQVGMNVGRGAAEGGIAGFMEGEGGLGDRVASAGQGAAFGAGAAGAFQGATELGRGIARQRVAQNLMGEDGLFRPLHIADPDSAVGKFYRNTVGGTFGGGEVLGHQESRYLRGNPEVSRIAASVGESVDDTVGTHGNIDRIKQAVRRSAKEGKRELKRTNEANVRSEELAGARALIDDAIPDSMDADTVAAIRGAETTNDAARLLDQWWSGPQAFSQVKNRSFRWNPKLQARIRDLLNQNPDVAAEATGQLGGKSRLEGMLTPPAGTTGTGTLSGAISGDDLMAIRNSGAIGANKGAQSLKGGRKRTIAQEIDDMIGDQMGRDSQEWVDYQDQLRRYSTKTGVSRAAEAAAKRLDDNFTPKDVGRKLSRATSAGTARDIGKTAQRRIEGAERAGKQAIDNLDDAASSDVQTLENLRKLMKEENKTFASRAINTSVLGFPLSGISPGALPAGVAVSSALATQRAQKAIAGQAPFQGVMRNIGDDERARMLARLLRENLSRQAAIQGTGD